MGFATSGATAVLFVGLLVGAGILLPTLGETRERTVEAEDDRNDRMLDRRNTVVETVDVGYDATIDRLTLDVKNTGSTTLAVAGVDVLVDGVYRADAAVRVGVEDDRSLWHPGERLIATVTVSPRPDRVKLVTGPGVAVTETGVGN
jgi:flagellar protein FlaF